MRSAATIALASVLLLGCGVSGESRPHLVLVVIDTLRADRIGAYGHASARTPTIDRLAEGGTRFERAFSPSSWTRPAIGSLFTSRTPSEHGATGFERPLSDALPTLAERLAQAGYRTVGVSGNFVHVARRSGMARGFSQWRSPSLPVGDADPDVLWPGERARRAAHAAEINRVVLRLLPEPDSAPLFLYVHYMDPHSPYGAGDGQPAVTSRELTDLAAGRRHADEAERRRILERYDAEVAEADAGLAELLAALDTRGYARERTVVALVADHGEAFGEHRSWFHGVTLHHESLHVPLVLHGPGIPSAVRGEPVDLLDVPTTLLVLAGAASAAGMHGRDLLAASLPSRPLRAEQHPSALLEARVGPRDHAASEVHWPWKGIVDTDGGLVVYRLDDDPDERRPLGPGESDDAPAGLAAIRPPPSEGPSAGGILEPEQREALRSLGYVE